MREFQPAGKIAWSAILLLIMSISTTANALSITVTSIATNFGDSGFQDSFFSDFEATVRRTS